VLVRRGLARKLAVQSVFLRKRIWPRSSALLTLSAGESHRINAEMLSKQYWVNFGLLGFLLISPRILTSRLRTASCTGVRLCRAVMITRIAPAIPQPRNISITFAYIS
jgi:hypothetical protein